MGTIKDRNSKDLTEAEEIKKRWQGYIEQLKKGLNDPDNHNGVVTHSEPDILACKVKWAIGSITMNKASGSDRIPNELFKILKAQQSHCWVYTLRKPELKETHVPQCSLKHYLQ